MRGDWNGYGGCLGRGVGLRLPVGHCIAGVSGSAWKCTSIPKNHPEFVMVIILQRHRDEQHRMTSQWIAEIINSKFFPILFSLAFDSLTPISKYRVDNMYTSEYGNSLPGSVLPGTFARSHVMYRRCLVRETACHESASQTFVTPSFPHAP